jgi:hypothetical protein
LRGSLGYELAAMAISLGQELQLEARLFKAIGDPEF